MTRKKSNKNLTLSEIKKLNKKLDEQKEVLLLDGEYSIKIDIKFKQTKIEAMINEMQRLAQYMSKQDGLTLEAFKDFIYVNSTLIIKHFTSLDLPDDFEGLIESCEYLIDIGVYKEIMDSFDQDELNKIDRTIREISSLKMDETMGEIVKKVMKNYGEEVTSE